jgi:hypothetical protein
VDDWFTYVLFFIFFVLPMLEGVLKKRRGRDVELPPDEEFPESQAPVRWEPSSPGGTATADSGGSSGSDGWGSWPGDEQEEDDEDEPERVPAWTAPRQPDRNTTEPRSADLPRVPVEVPAHVPEPVGLPELGRRSEPQRLPEIATRLDQIARVESSPTPIATLKPSTVSRPASVTKQRRSRVSSLLGDRVSVRRAIIVSEVLGPPLAMRESPRD